MSRRFSLFLPLLFLAIAPSGLRAADSAKVANNPSPLSPVEQEWATLQANSRPRSGRIQTGPDAASRAAILRQEIGGHLRQAERLKAFGTKYPADTHAHEARALETMELLYAAQEGDTTQADRRTTLVAEVRADPKLTERQRSQVAAFSDNLDVAMRPGLTRDQRLAAFEQTLRKLIKEFPDIPEGYKSMLQLAASSTEAHAQTMARELLSLCA